MSTGIKACCCRNAPTRLTHVSSPIRSLCRRSRCAANERPDVAGAADADCLGRRCAGFRAVDWARAAQVAPVASDQTADALFRELDERIEAAMARYHVPVAATVTNGAAPPRRNEQPRICAEYREEIQLPKRGSGVLADRSFAPVARSGRPDGCRRAWKTGARHLSSRLTLCQISCSRDRDFRNDLRGQRRF
jgi:hypothetical protein